MKEGAAALRVISWELRGFAFWTLGPGPWTLFRRKPILAIILVLALVSAHPAHAQGCAQCLDTTRATPPATQAAYRHAIELLAGVASALFIAGLILLRRNP